MKKLETWLVIPLLEIETILKSVGLKIGLSEFKKHFKPLNL